MNAQVLSPTSLATKSLSAKDLTALYLLTSASFPIVNYLPRFSQLASYHIFNSSINNLRHPMEGVRVAPLDRPG